MRLFGTRSGLLANGSVSVWSQISGPAVIINTPNSLATTVSGYGSGTYVFRISIKCRDGLLAEDFVTIGVTPVTIANAGIDSNYCPGVSFLNGNVPVNANETGTWVINGVNNAGVTIQSPTNANSAITLNNTAVGSTILRWTITNSSSGCTTFDEVKITNIGGVEPINAGPDQVLDNCFSTSTCASLMASNGGVGTNGQIGIWSFVSGPNIPTITPTDKPTSKVCNLIEGTYVFRYTVQGECASGFDDVTITVPAPSQDITIANANASGSSTFFCGLVNTFTLNGNAPLYAGETVLWTQISGPPVTINTPESPSTIITGLTGYGNYCFNYRIINNSSNCQKNNSICYTLYEQGTLDAGENQILACNVTSTRITPSKTGTGVIRYRLISGVNGVFTYPTQYTSSNTISGLTKPGTYRVEVNYVFGIGCPAINDFVDITVSRTPTGANAGSDQIFACNSTTTQLAGNNPVITGFGNGKWSQISGPNNVSLIPVSNYVCNVYGTIPGSYTFRWSINGGNACPENFDDINVIIPDTALTLPNAGNNRIVCPNSPVTLFGNNFRVDETGKWVANPNNVTFYPNNFVSNPIVSGMSANTTYTFIYTIANSCGSVSNDTVLISTSSSAGPSSANAGPDQCLPSGTSTINLNATIPVSGSGIWRQVSGLPVNIVDSALHNTSVTGISGGNYKFAWVISVDGCTNTSSDTVNIIISGTTTSSNAGTDASTCADAYTLIGNTPVFGTGRWTQISGDGNAIIVNPTNPTTVVSNLVTGVYIFRWTISNGPCASNYDDVSITISLPPSTANAGNDQSLCGVNAGSTSLNASPPSVGTGQWVQITGPNTAVIANRTLINTIVSGLTNGTYTFRWIVNGGPDCPQSTDDVLIAVNLPANAGQDQNLCNQTSTTLRGNTGSIGTWTQISGSSVSIIQSPAGNPSAIVSGLLQGNSYVFRYTISSSGSCPSSFDEITVNNGGGTQVPNAGNDTAYCNASSFALNGSLPGAGETGTWSVLSGPNGAVFFPNANTPNAILQNATSGLYIVRWTISNAVCASSDVKRIENYATTSLANAGADQVVCFGTATLQGNTPVNGIGTWTQIEGPATTIAAINNPISTVSGLNAVGLYKYVWTISNGICSVNKDTVNLEVTTVSPTIANAGTDQTLCNQTAIQLNGNLPVSGNGSWTNISPLGAIISSSNANNSLVNLLETGVYQFVWTIKNADGSCVSKDSVRIINSVQPNVANAGPDDTFCVFSNITLDANSAIIGTTGMWTLIAGPNTPIFISPNNSKSQVSGLIPGTYRFLWTISSAFCTSSTDEVKITIIENADLATAGINQNICATNTNFTANAPTGNNNGIWEQVEGPNTAIINSISNPVSTVSNLIPGNYRFVWKVFNERCFTTDTVELIIKQAAIVEAGNERFKCDRSPILLSGASVSSPDGTGKWTIISGGGSLNNNQYTSLPDTVLFTPEESYFGQVILRLSAVDSCNIVYDDVIININEMQIPVNAKNDFASANINLDVIINVLENDSVYISTDFNLCQQNSIITQPINGTALANIDGTVTYTPISNFSGRDSFQYQICVESPEDSLWLGNCFIGGADTAWVYITIEDGNCLIPNAFSPNGDGINDFFKIPCASENIKFNVFNSWGIQIYSSPDYRNDWNGMYKDSPLPDGTYYYTVGYTSFTNEEINRAGFITLHR